MPLPLGTRIGAYEVGALLGAGGMGEVYRARDTRLGRDVALKLIPELYAREPDYVSRFEREARLLAAVNHANVGAIHGVEEAGTTRALVLELIEGDTLDRLIEDGRLPAARAIDLARQIAAGLDAVHEKGIVHRDLKPANIKVTPDGVVKLIDFGLGRLSDDRATATTATITAGATAAGVVLGTAAYMSPEQARGAVLDKRTDIWAFGCVLYEMLTGSRAFGGPTWSDAIARVIGGEPDWTRLPAGVPVPVRRLLHRCLDKDVRRRLRDIGDAVFELDDAASGASDQAAAASAPDVRLERLTDTVGVVGSAALSPDGKMVAFVAVANGRRHIWIRMLAGGGALQVTRDDLDHDQPRWLPDSSAILYYSPAGDGSMGHLWQVSTLGGTPRRIARAASGADVSHDGRRLAFFRPEQGAIALVTTALDGSSSAVVLRLSQACHYSCPRWAPGDREIAFQEATMLFAAQLEIVGVSGSGLRTVARAGWLRGHAWLPDGSGLVYSSSLGSTLAYPPTNNLRVVDCRGEADRQLTFGDVSYLEPELRGSGRLVVSRVRSRSDVWAFPIDGAPMDNVGNAIRVTRQTGQIQVPSISPDGRWLAYVSDSGGHSNLWISGDEGTGATQITFERDPDVSVGVPIWTPQSDRIVFVRAQYANLDVCAISPDGSGMTTLAAEAFAPCCSPDGRWLYLSRPGMRVDKLDLVDGSIVAVRPNATGPVVGHDGTLYFTRLVEPEFAGRSANEICRAPTDDGPATPLARIPDARVPLAPRLWMHTSLSPDGRWLASPLLDRTTANIWLISASDGAMRPVTDFGDRAVFIARSVSWSPDSRQIYAAVADIDADIVVVDGLVG